MESALAEDCVADKWLMSDPSIGVYGGQSLRAQLLIWKFDDTVDTSERKRFRFTVVDLDKAKGYPVNFVCLLPNRLFFNGNVPTAFARIFGEESLDVAKSLLTDALGTEDDDEVRIEIERRLKLLDSGLSHDKTCVSCGKTFQTDPKKRFKQRFCEDCLKKKFGSRI